jgi:hypothetical protein
MTENNPAEELNRFPEATAGSHYGYPYCWTEWPPDKPTYRTQLRLVGYRVGVAVLLLLAL